MQLRAACVPRPVGSAVTSGNVASCLASALLLACIPESCARSETGRFMRIDSGQRRDKLVGEVECLANPLITKLKLVH